jgi:2-keto-3-deoxy-L-rhamnonate aldolase RhmA
MLPTCQPTAKPVSALILDHIGYQVDSLNGLGAEYLASGGAMRKNTVKEMLKAGQCVYGTSLEDCLEPEMPVILARAGLDFFFVDTEHCTASYAEIQALCRAAHDVNIVALVRVAENRPELITRTLDVGTMGIIVPRIHSADAGRTALEVMKFPPLGHRGFGLRSIITDLQGKSAGEEIESCNRETLAVLMIESKAGLEGVEEIAALPGVDVLFIGPYDLTLSLGIVEQFDNPIFWNAVDRVIAACRAAGIATGIQTSNMSLLKEARSRGARFLLYGSDVAILFAGFKRVMSELKEVTTSTGVLY